MMPAFYANLQCRLLSNVIVAAALQKTAVSNRETVSWLRGNIECRLALLYGSNTGVSACKIMFCGQNVNTGHIHTFY